ncbi:MAG TPA: hypothetical protein VFU16_04895 [Solirubrobacterales bacterium]|nr:hypothetical protein [Solirubrobacterales bacterium]
MSRGLRRQGPALVVAGLALVAALSGTVYAAAGKISGRSIKVKSIPGNRLALGSVPGNRLQPGALKGSQLAPGSITGVQIDASTLGPVPSSIHAETADSAHDAETALQAAHAEDARTVNGHEVGCKTGTRSFSGACWQEAPSSSALNAPAAAAACASQGGELPAALSLVAFSQQPGVLLDAGDEWASDIASFTTKNSYSVATVTSTGEVDMAISSATNKFRCVLPVIG